MWMATAWFWGGFPVLLWLLMINITTRTTLYVLILINLFKIFP